MKKFFLIIFLMFLAFLISSCEVMNKSKDFYAKTKSEDTSNNIKYTYYVFGNLDEMGKITSIRFDIVNEVGVSKRSSDYFMNKCEAMVGGISGGKTVYIFSGGSTSTMNYHATTLEGNLDDDGSTTLKELSYMSNGEEIIDDEKKLDRILHCAISSGVENASLNTLLSDFLLGFNLFDEETGLVLNGYTYIPTFGKYSGGSYDEQLSALEAYIIENVMSLKDVHYLLENSNNDSETIGDDIAGVTIVFDDSIKEVVSKAGNIKIGN